jgi:hypothetical protein
MDDEPPKPKDDTFDVVLVHRATDDGQGARVLRMRPGRVDAGEVRLMRDGKPLGRGEVVRLERRQDAPALYDVHVEHVIEPSSPAPVHGNGPAQVASPAYRESWLRTFGARRGKALN